MKYPDYKTYETLYAKYLKKENLIEMMDLAGDYNEKVFMDICCGNGDATREALKREIKQCVMIDKETKMIPFVYMRYPNVKIITSDVSNAFFDLCREKVFKADIIFCRQAINYWFSPFNIKLLSDITNKGGIFIFNTFNACPPTKPMIKEYEFEGSNFIEISYLTGNNIHHVQIREGYAPHITLFQWISPEMFEISLSPYFEIEKNTRKKTDIYKCVRK